MPSHARDKAQAGGHPKFPENIANVERYCPRCAAEVMGDLLIFLAEHDSLKHLDLTACQRRVRNHPLSIRLRRFVNDKSLINPHPFHQAIGGPTRR